MTCRLHMHFEVTETDPYVEPVNVFHVSEN